jgi:superfamily II DNA or RNA helicase
MTVKPRPYQQQGIADLRREFAAGRDRVLYVLPTGGG